MWLLVGTSTNFPVETSTNFFRAFADLHRIAMKHTHKNDSDAGEIGNWMRGILSSIKTRSLDAITTRSKKAQEGKNEWN